MSQSDNPNGGSYQRSGRTEIIADPMARAQGRLAASRIRIETDEGEPCQRCGSTSCPCPRCHGAHWVLPVRPDHGQDHIATETAEVSKLGDLVPCNCAAARIEYQRVQKVVGGSGMEKQRQVTFDSCPPRQGQQAAWKALKTFAANPEGWVWLWGPTRVGKTCLAQMAGNYQLDRGEPVLFILAGRILMKLDATRQQSGEGYPTTEAVSNSFSLHPFLIIDDYGRQRSTSYADEMFHTILAERASYRLPTIITSNTPFDEVDEAIQGRAREAAVAGDERRVFEIVSVEQSRSAGRTREPNR